MNITLHAFQPFTFTFVYDENSDEFSNNVFFQINAKDIIKINFKQKILQVCIIKPTGGIIVTPRSKENNLHHILFMLKRTIRHLHFYVTPF